MSLFTLNRSLVDFGSEVHHSFLMNRSHFRTGVQGLGPNLFVVLRGLCGIGLWSSKVAASHAMCVFSPGILVGDSNV